MRSLELKTFVSTSLGKRQKIKLKNVNKSRRKTCFLYYILSKFIGPSLSAFPCGRAPLFSLPISSYNMPGMRGRVLQISVARGWVALRGRARAYQRMHARWFVVAGGVFALACPALPWLDPASRRVNIYILPFLTKLGGILPSYWYCKANLTWVK